MRHRLLKIAALVATAAGAAPVRAAAPTAQWKTIGPWSESVEALALDPHNPKVVYVATREGIFKSTDGAESWVKRTKGIEKPHVLSLAVDPKTPTTLYAGALNGGLYKSVDGGETWKSLTPNKQVPGLGFVMRQPPVDFIAIDPVNPKNILFTSLYRSATGGAEIKEVEAGSGGRDIKHVAFDPKNPKIAYAAGIGDLIRSSDGGVTWSRVDYGVPQPAHAKVTAIHPKSGEILLGTGYNGLRKSTDGGKTWKEVGEGLKEKASIVAIAWDPNDAENVYVSSSYKERDVTSVFHSTDGGASFEDAGKDLPFEEITALVMDPTNPKLLYAGSTHSGVFKTTDGGKTWNEKDKGFESSFRKVRGLAVAGPGVVFVTSYGAVHRTMDDGKTWQRTRSGIEKGIDYEFVGARGGDKPHAVAGADDSRLVRSTDGGETWEDAPRSAPLRCIAPDPASPRAFYLCGKTGVLYAGDGPSWKFVSEDSAGFNALAVNPQNPQDIFAGGYHGLQRSTNGGKKWKEWKPFEKVKGGVARPAENRDVFAMAFDAKNPKTLYVATKEDGIFRSTDGGETWTIQGLTGEKLSAFALDPEDGQHLMVGTPDKGVKVSTDGGSTWTERSGGLPVDENSKKPERISGIAFAAGAPSKAYVATEGGGVYRAQ